MNWIENIIKEHNENRKAKIDKARKALDNIRKRISYDNNGNFMFAKANTFEDDIDQAADDIIDEFNDVDYD